MRNGFSIPANSALAALHLRSATFGAPKHTSSSLIVCFAPEPLRDLHRLYVGGPLPFLFVIAAMQIAVVNAAQRRRELVADLAPPGRAAAQTGCDGHRTDAGRRRGTVASTRNPDVLYRVFGPALRPRPVLMWENRYLTCRSLSDNRVLGLLTSRGCRDGGRQ